MSIGRCPACRNLVERDSVECPICGRGYAGAQVARLLRWAMVPALAGLIIYWLLAGPRSSGISPTSSSTTSLSVTIPSTPPYSSTSTTISVRAR